MSTKKNEAAQSAEEEVVDAKGGELATVPASAVSAEVAVEGVSLKFPFVRIGHGLSQWRCEGKVPDAGALYIGKDKSTNVRLSDPGEGNGIAAILLGVEQGYVEEKAFGGTPPRRFFGENALKDAEKEGLSLEKRQVGTWPDTGNPRMAANLSPFCILQVLIPVPDDFPSMEFQLFPIGSTLYTPGRIEFGKYNYPKLHDTLGNIRRVEEFRHRGEEGWKFNLSGKVGHIFTKEAVSKSTGNTYHQVCFDLASRDGRPFEFTDAEREDFVRFLASVTSTTVMVDDVEGDVNA